MTAANSGVGGRDLPHANLPGKDPVPLGLKEGIHHGTVMSFLMFDVHHGGYIHYQVFAVTNISAGSQKGCGC
jgi:hypothetical protein